MEARSSLGRRSCFVYGGNCRVAFMKPGAWPECGLGASNRNACFEQRRGATIHEAATFASSG
jgi:hypothetical protein